LEGGHSVLLNDVLSAKWSSDEKLMCPQVAHSTGRHQWFAAHPARKYWRRTSCSV